MGRRAAVTPGTDPQTETPEGEATAAVSAGVGDADLRALVEQNAREMAEMRATINALARNQIATAPAEKVELPDMADVIKANPKVPVLSKEGWFVPVVHPTDRARG